MVWALVVVARPVSLSLKRLPACTSFAIALQATERIQENRMATNLTVVVASTSRYGVQSAIHPIEIVRPAQYSRVAPACGSVG